MEKVDAILTACKRGDINEVERLLKADATLATASTMLGSQPIHAAYLGGHGAIVELLLSRGVQIDFFLASEFGHARSGETGTRYGSKVCAGS